MSLAAEMGRLTKEFSQASKFRASALDGMRRATKATLMECAAMRGDMIRDYRAQTHRFLASLAKDVAAHRRATTRQFVQLARARRNAAAKRQRASLDAGRRELRADVAGFLGSIRGDLANARDVWSAFKVGDSNAAMKRKRSKGIDAKRRKNAGAKAV